MKLLQDPGGSPRGARRRVLVMMAAAFSAVVVVTPLALPSRQDTTPEQAVAPAADAPAYKVTQATNCETPAGVCQLSAPQPVGSLCQCPGGATGRAIL